MTDIDRLMALIATHWSFDEMTYPELKGKNETEINAFGFHHSALHVAKTAGNIAAVLEQTHHGSVLDTDALKTQTGKMLINTLMLAHQLGLTGDDLIRFVEEKYHDKRQ